MRARAPFWLFDARWLATGAFHGRFKCADGSGPGDPAARSMKGGTLGAPRGAVIGRHRARMQGGSALSCARSHARTRLSVPSSDARSVQSRQVGHSLRLATRGYACCDACCAGFVQLCGRMHMTIQPALHPRRPALGRSGRTKWIVRGGWPHAGTPAATHACASSMRLCVPCRSGT